MKYCMVHVRDIYSVDLKPLKRSLEVMTLVLISVACDSDQLVTHELGYEPQRSPNNDKPPSDLIFEYEQQHAHQIYDKEDPVFLIRTCDKIRIPEVYSRHIKEKPCKQQ